jgi:hypothetical protein
MQLRSRKRQYKRLQWRQHKQQLRQPQPSTAS